MIRGLFFGLFIALPLGLFGQDPLFQELLATSPNVNSKVYSELDNFIGELREKRTSSDIDFVNQIFKKAHRKYFRVYKPYVKFSETLADGFYDCLTASSLLVGILQEFDFNVRIIETNYHIFLMVTTETGEILIESTDRYEGVITEAAQIQKKISQYKENLPQQAVADSGKEYFDFTMKLYQTVSPQQLPGLLYFNQAVVAYNQRNLKECVSLLEASNHYYESQRTIEFTSILVNTIIESQLDIEVKSQLIRPFIKSLKRSNVMAAR